MQLLDKAKGLEEIVLTPRVTLGLGVINKMNGKKCTGKSVSFSTQVSVLKMILIVGGVLVTLKGVMCFMKMRISAKARKRYREKLLQAKEKMSKK